MRVDSLHQGTINHTIVDMLSMSVGVVGNNKAGLLRITLNTTLGGSPSYTAIGATTSVVSYDTAGTTLTNGEILATYVLSKDSSIDVNLSLLKIFLSPSDILTVSYEAVATDSADVTCSLTFDEDM